jgi:hypothetical protein
MLRAGSVLAALCTLGIVACSANTEAPIDVETDAITTEADLKITFTGCTPDFKGKGVESGTLPHDGIWKCSQDDGSYNVGGYHLDLMRDGSGSDRERVIEGITWKEGQGREVGAPLSITVPKDKLTNVAGLKVWFGGHAKWITAENIPHGNELTCSVTLVGRYSKDLLQGDRPAPGYVKDAVLDCKSTVRAAGRKGENQACSATADCAGLLRCGPTYRCVDGCLGGTSLTTGGVKSEDEALACVNSCPAMCHGDLDI